MAHERGEYRSIRRVLLDGPDFQQLPERARFLFIVLKLNVGPTGIDVQYPAALAIQLEAQTGMPLDAVYSSLDALEAAGWIRREANVLWVVGHLENDPHMKASDEKHRKAVVKHLAGLPRLDIVRAFIAANRDFFPASDGPSQSLGWAIEGPSKGHRSREREREKDTERKNSPAGAGDSSSAASPAPPRPAFSLAPYLDAHRERFPDSDPPAKRYGAVFKRLEAKHGAEETLRRWRICLTRKGTFATPEELSAHWSEYAVEAIRAGPMIDPTLPLVDEWGQLTEYGERMTRPASVKANPYA